MSNCAGPTRPEKIPLTNVCLGLRAVRFTPGYNITDFQSFFSYLRSSAPSADKLSGLLPPVGVFHLRKDMNPQMVQINADSEGFKI